MTAAVEESGSTEPENVDAQEFVAEEAVKPLRYNFKTRTNPDGPNGDIPEPSFEKIKKFRKVMGDLLAQSMEGMPDGKDVANMPMSEQVRLIGSFLAKDGSDQQAATIKALSELCFIPRPVIEAQPFRIQQAFLSFIVGIFLIPTT